MTKVFCIGCGLVTPVGNSPSEVLAAVRAGKSAFRLYDGWPEPYYASLLDRQGFEGPSFFDHIALRAAREAVLQAGIDVSSPRVGLVLSTIKGNVEKIDSEDVSLAASARSLADGLGVKSAPVVVSNACISGLSAQIIAMRLLENGTYDTAVVIGADVQSHFIISGFQSLMALSPMECRPFDIERVGLNLGEAAATIIYDKVDQIGADEWQAVGGAVRNDAHHISNPSRTGEGSYRAIRAAMGEMPAERLAFVNVHGTSTLYNDEMEAVAVNRVGLKDVPVNSLKGYYGHTMGAAGVLETILSMQAVDDGCILGTRGFEELGVSKAVRVSAQNAQTDKRAFLKLLSGFGGCNAAMLFEKGGER